MQYQFIEQVDAKEHDAFVSKHKLCNLLQSSSWGLVKENWKHTIVGVKYQGSKLHDSHQATATGIQYVLYSTWTGSGFFEYCACGISHERAEALCKEVQVPVYYL